MSLKLACSFTKSVRDHCESAKKHARAAEQNQKDVSRHSSQCGQVKHDTKRDYVDIAKKHVEDLVG